MKRVTVSLITDKSYNALLRMLLVGIGSYLTPILTYKVVISDNYHPERLYLREQGYENP